MKFQFEILGTVESDFKSLVASRDFINLSPKNLVSLLITREAQRQQGTPQKVVQVKQSAHDRKEEERIARNEARKEADLIRFRSSGLWPRFNAPASYADNEDIYDFPVLPGEKTRQSTWTPPEDYPHFVEVETKRAAWEKTMANEEPTPAGEPCLEDFDGDEDALHRAKMAWLKSQWKD